MGYQTDFEVTFDADKATTQQVFVDLTIISGYVFDNFYLYNAKWYEHDRDMRELSKKYPDILFTVYGRGEESDDMWYAYYQNGKSQHCPAEIVFPEYDPEKMS
jgi:hypothetical protein